MAEVFKLSAANSYHCAAPRSFNFVLPRVDLWKPAQVHANNNSRIMDAAQRGMGHARQTVERLLDMPLLDGHVSASDVIELGRDARARFSLPLPKVEKFRLVGRIIGRRMALGYRASMEPDNRLGSGLAILSIVSNVVNVPAALSDTLVTMQVVGTFSAVVGIVTSLLKLFSLRGAQSPYVASEDGKLWKSALRTWKKAAISPDASTDYCLRSWALPMAFIGHSNQLINAFVFKRYDQLGPVVLGLPGEIVNNIGAYLQARRTRAVEQGFENPDVAANKTTRFDKGLARVKEYAFSSLGGYVIGLVETGFWWMDAYANHDPNAVWHKHVANVFQVFNATIGTGDWYFQRKKGFGESVSQKMARRLAYAWDVASEKINQFPASKRELTHRAARFAAGALVAFTLHSAPEQQATTPIYNKTRSASAWHASMPPKPSLHR